MRSSRSSAVTQFREAFSSSSSRAVLPKVRDKVALRAHGARAAAPALLGARARLFLPRHLLGPRRGLERLRGFPRRLRLLDARARSDCTLRRLASARALKSAAHSLRSALSCDSHARRRSGVRVRPSDRTRSRAPRRTEWRTRARPRRSRTRARGRPRARSVRRATRDNPPSSTRAPRGEASRSQGEGRLRVRRLGTTSSGASGDASHGRGTAKAITRDAGVLHAKSLPWRGSCPTEVTRPRRARLADAPREKAPYWMSLKCAKMNDDTTKNSVRSLRYKRFCMSIQSKRFCLVPGSRRPPDCSTRD